ncbi:unnamed protein product [Gadus morhua 'NCC']
MGDQGLKEKGLVGHQGLTEKGLVGHQGPKVKALVGDQGLTGKGRHTQSYFILQPRSPLLCPKYQSLLLDLSVKMC